MCLVATWPPFIAGPVGVGALFGTGLSAPLLFAEYRSVFRRSRRATLLVAYLLGYLALLGSIGWVIGLLDILHWKHPHHDAMDPATFAIYSTVWAGAIVAGLGHLRWYRRLLPRGGN